MKPGSYILDLCLVYFFLKIALFVKLNNICFTFFLPQSADTELL